MNGWQAEQGSDDCYTSPRRGSSWWWARAVAWMVEGIDIPDRTVLNAIEAPGVAAGASSCVSRGFQKSQTWRRSCITYQNQGSNKVVEEDTHPLCTENYSSGDRDCNIDSQIWLSKKKVEYGLLAEIRTSYCPPRCCGVRLYRSPTLNIEP